MVMLLEKISGSSTSTGSFGRVESNTLDVSGNGNFGGNVVVEGDITAQNYIVSSSVTNITTQELSGSTIFGDDTDDTHQFTAQYL